MPENESLRRKKLSGRLRIYGVWQASNEEVITAIQKALEVGYRSIDTAAAYKNEEGVGKALK
ncbi:aldo/keto reductase, partial [Escherichia coli]|uniref:aldo/keto reductase n=1 Tax=Escherichia coli TaxID=562 RepID=UPI001951BDFF